MKRTIIKQNQSYTLTLPKKWIEQHRLKPGQEVELISENGYLTISTFTQGEKRKQLQVANFNKSFIRSIIASAYKAGYTEITLTFTNPPQFNEIYSIANSFTGLEVVSQTKNTIILRSFLATKKDEVENLITKLFQIATHISKVIDEDWTKVNLPELLLLKENAKKLRDHTLRMINSTDFGGERSYDYYDFVTQLEKTIAELCIIAQYINTAKPKKGAIPSLLNNIEQLYSAYLKKDFTAAQSCWEEANNLTKKISNPKNKDIFLLRSYALANACLHLASRLLSLTSEIPGQNAVLSGSMR